MAFKFTAIFTGICSFVPHSEKNKHGYPKAFCVLLPDCRNVDYSDNDYIKKSTVDDYSRLERHVGILKYGINNLENSMDLTGDPMAIMKLNRHRILIDHKKPGNTKDHIIVNKKGQYTFESVVEMERVAPKCAKVDSGALSLENCSSTILSQIYLTGGEVKVIGKDIDGGGHSALSDSEWRIPNWLGGDYEDATQIAQRVAIELNDVECVTLRIWGMDKGDELKPLIFKGDSNSEVQITIGNFCIENPLEWDYNPPAKADTDFLWHYEILDSDSKFRVRDRLEQKRKSIKEVLDVLEKEIYLPYPFPVRNDEGLPDGDNCSPDRKQAEKFDIP